MKTFELNIIRHGVLIIASLIAFFSIISALDLVHNVELRILNAFILFAGVFSSIKSAKKADIQGFNFLNGYATGALVALFTSVGFTGFIQIFLVTHPAFLTQIQLEEVQGMHMNNWNISALILIESLASGILFTHMSVIWLKKDFAVSVK
ncbi:MAG: hypothetical protein JXQ90_03685 [Cyclobacteriaceae bacterium]